MAEEVENAPLERVLRALEGERLTVEFQPMFRLDDGALLGVEALSRFRLEPARPPAVWFAEARAVGLGIELETLAVRRAVEGIGELSAGALLFVNASAETVRSPALGPVLDLSRPGTVVVEMPAAGAAAAASDLGPSIRSIRDRGVRIAIDEAGPDLPSLETVLELEPDFVKLDIGICRNIHMNVERRDRAGDVVSAVRGRAAALAAVGIESRGELETLRSLAITFGQGYFLAVPGRLPLTALEDVASRVTGVRRPNSG